MKKMIAVAVLAALAATGCSQRVADLTLASTKNVDINSGSFVKGERITGEDSKPIILFPLGVPQVKEAADKAIEKDKCVVALSDVVVDYNYFVFLIFGSNGYTVEGTQLADTSIKGCENWKPTPLATVDEPRGHKSITNK